MKLTFIIGSLGLGGKERQLYYLIKNLPKEIDKQLIVLSERILIEDIYNHLENIAVVSRKDKYRLKTIKQLYKKVGSFRPDIVHCWDGRSPFVFFPYSILKKARVINGSIRTARPVKKFSWNYLLGRVRTKITDVSVSNSKKGLDVLGLAGAKKARYIHNGFDLELLDRQMNSSDDSFAGDKLHIIMVGRFFPLKGYKTLLKAATIINDKNPNVEFHLVGDGPMKPGAEVFTQELGLQNVVFHGRRGDVPALLANCDIGVLLNPKERAEGIPNTVMEYMAAQLPVVATNAGGTPELVEDGVNGYLVQPEDHVEAAEKILHLIQHKDERTYFGKQGREIIEKKFSITRMVGEYITLYKTLLR